MRKFYTYPLAWSLGFVSTLAFPFMSAPSGPPLSYVLPARFCVPERDTKLDRDKGGPTLSLVNSIKSALSSPTVFPVVLLSVYFMTLSAAILFAPSHAQLDFLIILAQIPAAMLTFLIADRLANP